MAPFNPNADRHFVEAKQVRHSASGRYSSSPRVRTFSAATTVPSSRNEQLGSPLLPFSVHSPRLIHGNSPLFHAINTMPSIDDGSDMFASPGQFDDAEWEDGSGKVKRFWIKQCREKLTYSLSAFPSFTEQHHHLHEVWKTNYTVQPKLWKN